MELGADTLERYVEQAGLTSSYSVDGIPTLASSIPLEGLSEGQLAWAGVGQAKDSVNPLSMLVYMGAVANGGRAAVPRLSLIHISWGLLAFLKATDTRPNASFAIQQRRLPQSARPKKRGAPYA